MKIKFNRQWLLIAWMLIIILELYLKRDITNTLIICSLSMILSELISIGDKIKDSIPKK